MHRAKKREKGETPPCRKCAGVSPADALVAVIQEFLYADRNNLSLSSPRSILPACDVALSLGGTTSTQDN